MDIKEHFKTSVMNREVKVELKDKRVIFGRLTCIDKHKNLVV
jgi:small nuclear ribonucleoprotein (snRNP)-like protein